MKTIKKYIKTALYDVSQFVKNVRRKNLKYAFAIQLMFLDDTIKTYWARKIANKCYDYAISVDYDEECMRQERLRAEEILYETQFLIDPEDYGQEIDEYEKK